MNLNPSSGEVIFRIGSAADLRVVIQGLERQNLLTGIPDTDRKLIATIASELGANIVKYAGRGALRICRAERMHAVDVDIWAEDQGQGIEDIDRAMSDRFSTGGTLGLGLPGVKRMADEFWIRSKRGQGTLVFARKTFRNGPGRRATEVATPAQVQSVKVSGGQAERYAYTTAWRPYPGNPFSGDAACVVADGSGCLMAMVDASGHGRGASQVAQEVIDVVQRYQGEAMQAVFQKVHDALQSTVGAALGLIQVDGQANVIRYAAIGNTRAVKISGKAHWIGIARDGVLGSRLPSLQVQEVPLLPGDRIVMWTDGIPDFEGRKLVEQNSLKEHRELATMLVQELAKPYDDACCLALSWT